ncbi:MAG TPA: Uma2 family endonuclease [Gemmataceae bacterium]|nr:Uma2 family endonuclease [Gemmataceae bacterium]
MSTVPAQAAVRDRLLLNRVDWRTYTRLLCIFADRRGYRLTYDRGALEIMSPLPEHESDADFLGRLATTLTEELGLPIKAGRSTTLRRKRKQRGLEPDCCYWIANEPAMRGKRDLDLRVDPPPDLAIEVDVTSSSLNRMGIYRALGVPEVWRLDDQTLTFHVLGANRTYGVVSHSLSFPLVTAADLLPFFASCASQEENSVIRQFREWIRQRIVGGQTSPTP